MVIIEGRVAWVKFTDDRSEAALHSSRFAGNALLEGTIV